MAAFDLERFRDLAFGRAPQPDHPLRSVADAGRAIAELPADAEAGLAELTALARSMNETPSFSAGRRARLLLELDDAARPRWRSLSFRYLAPEGAPQEGKDGDATILRAMFDSATEFTDGFGIALDAAGDAGSVWIERNAALLCARNMRWLGRRLALAHMLSLPVTAALWERLHRLYRLAEKRGVGRQPVAVFKGNRFTSSVRQEYVRSLLLDLASPDGMTGRQVELAYRVTGRVASSVRLEPQAGGAAFALLPEGDNRPAPLRRVRAAKGLLYLDTSGCLPKLQAGLERDRERDPAGADPLYSEEFSLRERYALLQRLLRHWGMDPPQRQAKRVSLSSPAQVIGGFGQIVEVLPPLEQNAAPAARVDLQLMANHTTRSLSRARLRAASRVGPARVIDASNGGLGMSVKRTDARWAKNGTLVAVRIEPATEWVVGVLRRVFSIDGELRLGVQVLSTRPRVLVFSTESTGGGSVWDEALRFEGSTRDGYRKAILLDPAAAPPAAAGELLLEPGLAPRVREFEVPLGLRRARLRVARVLADFAGFQRVAVEAAR